MVVKTSALAFAAFTTLVSIIEWLCLHYICNLFKVLISAQVASSPTAHWKSAPAVAKRDDGPITLTPTYLACGEYSTVEGRPSLNGTYDEETQTVNDLAAAPGTCNLLSCINGQGTFLCNKVCIAYRASVEVDTKLTAT